MSGLRNPAVFRDQSLEIGQMIFVVEKTTYDRLAAEVLCALRRGESFNATRARLQPPTSAVGIDRICQQFTSGMVKTLKSIERKAEIAFFDRASKNIDKGMPAQNAVYEAKREIAKWFTQCCENLTPKGQMS